jgi:hypothetical protein
MGSGKQSYLCGQCDQHRRSGSSACLQPWSMVLDSHHSGDNCLRDTDSYAKKGANESLRVFCGAFMHFAETPFLQSRFVHDKGRYHSLKSTVERKTLRQPMACLHRRLPPETQGCSTLPRTGLLARQESVLDHNFRVARQLEAITKV